MDSQISVSVIVPAYNAAATIDKCIESLLAQQTEEPFEILIVDDGSSDDSAERAARHPKVRVLRQQNGGASAARNLGAQEARGSVLCMIDADCEATPGWIEAFARTLEGGADGAKGVLATDQREFMARFTQIEYEDRYDRMSPDRPINFIDTGSAAYRRETFLAAGGFDETIREVEDQELSFRLARQGADLRFVPQAIVYHRHPVTLQSYVRRKFDTGIWKVAVMGIYPERMVSDSHTPPSLKAQVVLLGGILASLFAAPLHRDSLKVSGGLTGLFLASTLPFVLKATRKDPVVGLLSPLMLIVRSVSLGSGAAYGLARFGPAALKAKKERGV